MLGGYNRHVNTIPYGLVWPLVGPDCWSADLLLYMPDRWWQCAAKPVVRGHGHPTNPSDLGGRQNLPDSQTEREDTPDHHSSHHLARRREDRQQPVASLELWVETKF